MSDDRPVVDREALADWLRSIHFDGTGCGTNGTSGCSNCCGPSPMNAYELAEAIVESSGVVQKADDVQAEALAPIEALCDKASDVPWGVRILHVDDIRAVLAGDTSAFDAVKREAYKDGYEEGQADRCESDLAAERERIAQAIEAEAQAYVSLNVREVAASGARIARKGGKG